MTAKCRQNKDFRDQLISESLLENALDWIANNLPPEDVFSEAQLEEWAIDTGFIKPDQD